MPCWSRPYRNHWATPKVGVKAAAHGLSCLACGNRVRADGWLARAGARADWLFVAAGVGFRLLAAPRRFLMFFVCGLQFAGDGRGVFVDRGRVGFAAGAGGVDLVGQLASAFLWCALISSKCLAAAVFPLCFCEDWTSASVRPGGWCECRRYALW